LDDYVKSFNILLVKSLTSCADTYTKVLSQYV